MRASRRHKGVVAAAALVAAAYFGAFYADFLSDPGAFVFSAGGYHDDWHKEVTYYTNIRHQVLGIGRFPHHQPGDHLGTNALFANPETAVLSPITLGLAVFDVPGFFRLHLGAHYAVALLGCLLLARSLSLPIAAAFFAWVLIGFNGRFVANYWCGHSMFVTLLWFPLALHCILEIGRRRVFSVGLAATLTAMFFGGGVHMVVWTALFIVVAEAARAVVLLVRRERATARLRPLAIALGLFVAFAAVKLLPAALLFGGYDPDDYPPYPGFPSIAFVARSLGEPGFAAWYLGQPNGYLQYGYNFIGPEATLLGVLALVYSAGRAEHVQVRALGIAALVFAALSMGTAYETIFGALPVLKGERVGTRFLFVTLMVVAILIPVFVDAVAQRFGASRRVREAVLAVLSLGLAARLYVESRVWLLPGVDRYTLADVPLVSAATLAEPMQSNAMLGPATAYAPLLIAGALISIASVVATAVWLRRHDRP